MISSKKRIPEPVKRIFDKMFLLEDVHLLKMKHSIKKKKGDSSWWGKIKIKHPDRSKYFKLKQRSIRKLFNFPQNGNSISQKLWLLYNINANIQ